MNNQISNNSIQNKTFFDQWRKSLSQIRYLELIYIINNNE